MNMLIYKPAVIRPGNVIAVLFEIPFRIWIVVGKPESCELSAADQIYAKLAWGKRFSPRKQTNFCPLFSIESFIIFIIRSPKPATPIDDHIKTKLHLTRSSCIIIESNHKQWEN